MARKLATYKGYDTLNTYYTDTSLLSPDIFDISFFPNTLTVGKNLIKFRGNSKSLKVGSIIDIEILDSNGDTVYSEFIDYIDIDEKTGVIDGYLRQTRLTDGLVILKIRLKGKFINKMFAGEAKVQVTSPVNFTAEKLVFESLN